MTKIKIRPIKPDIFTLHGWILLACLISLLAGACSRRPKNVLSDSEMESLLTDLIIADAYERSSYSRELPDSVRRSLGDAVMAQHNVDQATLDSTMAWYGRNLDDYYNLYAKVDRKLAKLSNNARGEDDKSNTLNDIWRLPKSIMLSPIAKSDMLIFELPGDVVAKGERLEWYFRLNTESKVDVALGIDYDNGATALVRRPLSSSKIVSYAIMADTALTPRRVFGFIRADRRDLPLWLDSIRLTKSPYDSTAYADARNSHFYMPPKLKKIDF